MFTNLKGKFAIANPVFRAIARATDYLFLVICLFIINVVLINSNDLSALFGNFDKYRLASWKFILAIVDSSFLMIIYFVAIPYLTNGYTLFSYVFRMRLVKKNSLRLPFIAIVKREMILTGGILIANFFKLATVENNSIINLVAIINDTSNPWIIISKALEGANGFLMFLTTVMMFATHNKLALHDIISDVLMISTKSTNPRKQLSELEKAKLQKYFRRRLPGEIEEEQNEL